MTTLSEKNEKILKITHVFAMSLWTGSLFIMFVINILIPKSPSSDAFYFVHDINSIIDLQILTPAAILTFLTGVVYAVFTKWKVKENLWLKIKLAITILLILMGTFWLAPLLMEMTGNAKEYGMGLLSDAGYLFDLSIITWFSLVNWLLIIVAIVISTLKPGSKDKLYRINNKIP